jgi:RNA polymerase sigma factor (sigma-70 family)
MNLTASQSESQAPAAGMEDACMPLPGSTAEPEITGAVQAVLAGHPDAYALIVKRFQSSVMTVAMMLMRDRQAAEELTQDAFVRAHRSLSSFDQSRPMKPWLMKIVYRLAQDAGRHRATEGRQQRWAEQQFRQVVHGPGPLEHLIADERARSLWQALEVLPMAERTAAILYYREGLSVEQVAQATEVSPGTVKTLLFRARGHLRTVLNQPAILGPDRGAL